MPITVLPDPLAIFRTWYEEAQSCGLKEPTAMTLATADTQGRPSCRVVLLKGYDTAGFSFYTNRESRKGRQLGENPHAALCFHWMPLARQVRVEGRVEPVPDAESDAYYASRARGSRIGAWASQQSRPLEDVEALKARVQEVEARYDGQNVPRPAHWGGYRLIPHYMEFWQEQPFRLHDRLIYKRESGETAWQTELLYP